MADEALRLNKDAASTQEIDGTGAALQEAGFGLGTSSSKLAESGLPSVEALSNLISSNKPSAPLNSRNVQAAVNQLLATKSRVSREKLIQGFIKKHGNTFGRDVVNQYTQQQLVTSVVANPQKLQAAPELPAAPAPVSPALVPTPTDSAPQGVDNPLVQTLEKTVGLEGLIHADLAVVGHTSPPRTQIAETEPAQAEVVKSPTEKTPGPSQAEATKPKAQLQTEEAQTEEKPATTDNTTTTPPAAGGEFATNHANANANAAHAANPLNTVMGFASAVAPGLTGAATTLVPALTQAGVGPTETGALKGEVNAEGQTATEAPAKIMDDIGTGDNGGAGGEGGAGAGNGANGAGATPPPPSAGGEDAGGDGGSGEGGSGVATPPPNASAVTSEPKEAGTELQPTHSAGIGEAADAPGATQNGPATPKPELTGQATDAPATTANAPGPKPDSSQPQMPLANGVATTPTPSGAKTGAGSAPATGGSSAPAATGSGPATTGAGPAGSVAAAPGGGAGGSAPAGGGEVGTAPAGGPEAGGAATEAGGDAGGDADSLEVSDNTDGGPGAAGINPNDPGIAALADAKGGGGGVVQRTLDPAAANAVQRQTTKESLQAAPVLKRRAQPGVIQRTPIAVEEPPAPKPTPAPAAHPGFSAVKGKVEQTRDEQKKHEPTGQKQQAIDAAAQPPSTERENRAEANQVGKMGDAPTGSFNVAEFVDKLTNAAAGIAPHDENALKDFPNSGKAQSLKSNVANDVKDNQQTAQKDLQKTSQDAPDQGAVQPKPVTALSPEKPGSKPQVSADSAIPDKRPDSDVNLDYGPKAVNEKMAANNPPVTDDILLKANEPKFSAAVDDKKKMEDNAKTAPQQFRQQEQTLRDEAKGGIQGATDQKLDSVFNKRTGSFEAVTGTQTTGKGKDDAKYGEVMGNLNRIYNDTKKDVDNILSELPKKVDNIFGPAADRAAQNLNSYIQGRIDKLKDDRHDIGKNGGEAIWNGLCDTFAGVPKELVEPIYNAGKEAFVAEMRGVATQIANIISADLTAAKNRIAQGRQQVQQYLASLPQDLKGIGDEAAQDINDKFSDLNSSVDDSVKSLEDDMTQKFTEAGQKADQAIKDLREKNKGLVDKAASAIGDVLSTLGEIKDKLLAVISKAAGVFLQILQNPMGFVTNLIQAGIQGIQKFMANFPTHLKNGILGWLGNLLGGAIQLPPAFDWQGIVSIVMQVAGLSYQNIRQRAAKIVGEKEVGQLEQVAALFQSMAGNIGGIIKFIQEHLNPAEIFSTVFEGIRDWVIQKVIGAVVTKIATMFIPGGGLLQLINTAVQFGQFIIQNGAQLADFANSILDSIEAIVGGNIGGAASKVEQTLANALPLAIGMLAKLLGLDGIGEKIKDIIGKVQKPVNKAIDFVIGKVGGKFKAVMAKVQQVLDKIKGQAQRLLKQGQQKLQSVTGQIKTSYAEGQQSIQQHQGQLKQQISQGEAEVQQEPAKLTTEITQGKTALAELKATKGGEAEAAQYEGELSGLQSQGTTQIQGQQATLSQHKSQADQTAQNAQAELTQHKGQADAATTQAQGKLSPFGNGISKIREVIKGGIAAAKNAFTQIKAGVAQAGQFLQNGYTRLKSGLGSLKSKIQSALSNIRNTISSIKSKIQSIIAGIKSKVQALIQRVKDAIARLKQKVTDTYNKLTGKDTPAKPASSSNGNNTEAKVQAGLAQLAQQTTLHEHNGKLSKHAAHKVTATVKSSNPIFNTLEVIDSGSRWDYKYTLARMVEKGGEKEEEETSDKDPTLGGRQAGEDTFVFPEGTTPQEAFERLMQQPGTAQRVTYLRQYNVSDTEIIQQIPNKIGGYRLKTVQQNFHKNLELLRKNKNIPEPQKRTGETQATSEREKFPESVQTAEQAFEHLGGNNPATSFGRFVKILEDEGIASREELIGNINFTPGMSLRTVRHDQIKVHYWNKLLNRIFEDDHITKTPAYQQALQQFGGDKDKALLAARHAKFLELSSKLDSGDRGSLGERFIKKLEKSDPARLNISKEEAQQLGVTLNVDERIFDQVYDNTIRDIKNYSGADLKQDADQLQDLTNLLGKQVQVTPAKGSSSELRTLNNGIITMPDPQGVKKNRNFIANFLGLNKGKNVSFQVFNIHGEMKTITSENLQYFNSSAFMDWLEGR